MNTKVRTCYISAPIGTNIEHIRRSLVERGVKLLTLNDFPSDESISTNILALISRADLVVGVLSRDRQSLSVVFELGQASALGREIVVIASPKSSYIPFALSHFLVSRLSLRNRTGIDFIFEQVLSAPTSSKMDRTLTHQGKSLVGERIEGLMHEAQQAINEKDGLRLEKVVGEAIRDSGVEIIVKALSPHEGADFAVWSNVFQSLLGNPLLVEIKTQLHGNERVLESIKRCEKTARDGGVIWSLLLYGDGPSKMDPSWTSIAPTVLLLSIRDLFQALRERPFVDIVVDLRNRRVHGEKL